MFVQADILSFLQGEIVVRWVQENPQTEEFAKLSCKASIYDNVIRIKFGYYFADNEPVVEGEALELVEFIKNITYME